MRHAPPKSAGRCTCHTWWSFHLKCGKDHDGCRQIHDAPKGSLGSHLGLCNPVHIRHCVLNGQRFKFLGDTLPTIALVGPSEPDDLRYAFPIAYRM
jgi:hypothetical protein